MTWIIRVCSHGHRVEFNYAINRWIHMDAPEGASFCDNVSEQPRTVIVTEVKDISPRP